VERAWGLPLAPDRSRSEAKATPWSLFCAGRCSAVAGCYAREDLCADACSTSS